MKNKEKQQLRSSSILLLFGLLVVSLSIIATPWNRTMNDGRQARALQRAEIVGYQLVQLYREASKNLQTTSSASRGPASMAPDTTEIQALGTMGMDPWGQAYHYRILSTDQNKLRVLVWSSGPDQAVQSVDLEDENFKIAAQPAFVGDDVGLVMTMKTK